MMIKLEMTKRQWAMNGYRIKDKQDPIKITTCGHGGRTEYFGYNQVMPDMYAIGEEIQRQKEMRRTYDLRKRIWRVYRLSEIFINSSQRKEPGSTLKRIKRNWQRIDISGVKDEGIQTLYSKTKILVDSL